MESGRGRERQGERGYIMPTWKKATSSRANTMKARDDSPSIQGKRTRGEEQGKEKKPRRMIRVSQPHQFTISPQRTSLILSLQASQSHQSVEPTSPTHIFSNPKEQQPQIRRIEWRRLGHMLCGAHLLIFTLASRPFHRPNIQTHVP